MREIGGYIEFENYDGNIFHERAIPLNIGRNCLRYLIKSRNIKKIALPYFLCDSVINLCKKEKLKIVFYHVNQDLLPCIKNLEKDTWLYIVNYYAQIPTSNLIGYAKEFNNRIIVDNAQAYFEMPIEGIDTIYTCRKLLGVSDGAFLYTNKILNEKFPQDESFNRMNFLLGRYERTASEFYKEYVENNKMFSNEPIKFMSKLTENLLRGINYKDVINIRSLNFEYLAKSFENINKLRINNSTGMFAYPLWIKNGYKIRKKLLSKKIYIPTLWPNVINELPNNCLEFDLAMNILPIPCDQRYDIRDMKYIVEEVRKCLNSEN